MNILKYRVIYSWCSGTVSNYKRLILLREKNYSSNKTRRSVTPWTTIYQLKSRKLGGARATKCDTIFPLCYFLTLIHLTHIEYYERHKIERTLHYIYSLQFIIKHTIRFFIPE